VKRILRLVTGRAGWVLVIIGAVTLLAVTRIVDLGSGLPRLYLDPSVNSMLPSDDPGRKFYDHVRRVFGNDENILVVLHDEDAFTAENLRRVQRLTERLGRIDGVHHVVSLGNALNIRGVDGDLLIEPVIGDVPDDPAELAEIRRNALSDAIYAGNLVSRDGRSTAIMVYLKDMPERVFLESGIDDEISRIADEEGGTVTVWVTGNAHVKAEMVRLLMRDLTLIVPLAVVVMAGVALISFRTIRGVLVPLSTIVIALIWTMAAVAELFGSLNQVTVAAPPILLVVGFAYAIHVVSGYYDVLRGAEGRGGTEGPVYAALLHVALPVLLTGVTTAAGFLSLATSPIGAIREFGIVSGLGVVFTTFVALTYAPALLQVLPIPDRVRARPARDGIDRALEAVARFDLRHRRALLLAGALIAVASLWGMTRIVISTDLVENFRTDNEVRLDFEAVNANLEGSNAFFVVLEADYRDAFKEPVNLRHIEALQQWLTAQPEIGGTTSLVDYVKAIHRGFHGNADSDLRIPDSKRLITQLLFFGGNDELENFVDSRYQTVSLLVRTRAIDSRDVASLVRRVEAHLGGLPEHLKPTVTGNTVLVSKTIDDIAYGQAVSLSTALIMIYAILALLFTSFRVGLIALIPNLLPVVFYFGVLGFTGVTLNTTTGLVACLVLGIAVDDTIHLLAQFNRSAKRLADENAGVVEALRSVGRPVTYTTAALCLGFLVLTQSEMRNQVEFGALASFTLGFAWLIDVTFTPALAARMRIVTLWDVLTLDLGDDPHTSIPLFSGLKQTQARLVALMTSLRRFPKGHRLFRAGDEGDEMYVVIDGELSASADTEGGPVTFGVSRRGDVVGEVALFHGRRTADVEALSDVRLLQLTGADLERVRRRYPRTGAVLYRNLSRVLANRVATTTDHVRAAEPGRR
jgi:predicted RND superfamily exporter protein